MTEKGAIIAKLSEAKTKHERWMSYADAIYNGINIGEEHTPMMHTDCQFGKWMQENSELCYKLEFPDSINEDHKSLHRVYMEIYKIMKQESSSNIFNKGKIEKAKKEALEKNVNALKLISSSLIKAIDNIIENLRNTSDEKFLKLIQIN